MVNPKIHHPFIALGVYFVMGIVLYQYGISNGTMLILDVFLGMAMYKFIISWM